MTLRRTLRGDEGQAMIVVLVVVVAFSLISTSLLGLASATAFGNTKTTSVIRQSEAADAGVEQAIQRVKLGSGAALGSAMVTQAAVTIGTESVTSSLVQRNFTTATITGPTSAVRNQTTQYTVTGGDAASTAANGLTWSATIGGSPVAAGVLDKGGRFAPTVAGSYILSAAIGNVSATLAVTVP